MNRGQGGGVHTYMSFQDQVTLNTLRTLQHENTAFVEHPKAYVIPGNKGFYPIHSRPTSLDFFQDIVERDLTVHNRQKENDSKQKGHISTLQQRALKELTDNPHIIIRNADKGGAVVVLNKELYRLQNNDILKDATTYRTLPGDPTWIF